MSVPYTFASATGSIPLSQLDANFATGITIGNSSVLLGGTITTLNNMSLANVAITSVNTQFPNGFLANSNVIVGTTTINLGSTVTTVDGLTLSNVTISSGNVTISNVTVSNFSATTANVSGTANVSNLVVIGNASVGGNVTITGNVSAAKGTFTSSNISGTANVQILAVTQNATVAGNATVTGNVSMNVGTITTANVTTTNTSSIIVTGNQTFVGTGNRITGDFSNATVANRVMFQTSTVNGATRVEAIPNGTGTTCNLAAYNNSDPTNASAARLTATSSESRVESTITGTGTYLPMTFYTNGAEQLRLTTGGALQFSQTGMRITGDFSNATQTNRVAFQTSTTNGNTTLTVIPNGTAAQTAINLFDNSDPTNAGVLGIVSNSTEKSVRSTISGTSTYLPLTFYTNGSESARIDTSQRLLVTAASGLGYGTGAGGTVTQATSKTTAVTLNKPTGQITMNNAALAAATTVAFTVNNSTVASPDIAQVTASSGASNWGNYNWWTVCAAGAMVIYVKNISAGSLSEALVFNFAIIKGATS